MIFPCHFVQRLAHSVTTSRATLPFESAWIPKAESGGGVLGGGAATLSLRQLGGPGKRFGLPQWGSGQSPDRPEVSHYLQLSLSIWHYNIDCGLSCSHWGGKIPVRTLTLTLTRTPRKPLPCDLYGATKFGVIIHVEIEEGCFRVDRAPTSQWSRAQRRNYWDIWLRQHGMT